MVDPKASWRSFYEACQRKTIKKHAAEIGFAGDTDQQEGNINFAVSLTRNVFEFDETAGREITRRDR